MTDVGNLGPDLSPRRSLSGEELRGITADLDDFLKSDEQQRTVELRDGSTLELVKDPEAPGGVRISKDGLSFPPMGMDAFEADERPEDYPEDLPFVPGATTHVTHIPGRGLFSAIWMMVDDPHAVFDEVEAWHRQHGWEEVGELEDQAARLQQAREKMAETMAARGISEDEVGGSVQSAMEALLKSRRVRLAKGDASRGISVMTMPDSRGMVTLFAKPSEGDD